MPRVHHRLENLPQHPGTHLHSHLVLSFSRRYQRLPKFYNVTTTTRRKTLAIRRKFVSSIVFEIELNPVFRIKTIVLVARCTANEAEQTGDVSHKYLRSCLHYYSASSVPIFLFFILFAKSNPNLAYPASPRLTRTTTETNCRLLSTMEKKIRAKSDIEFQLL